MCKSASFAKVSVIAPGEGGGGNEGEGEDPAA